MGVIRFLRRKHWDAERARELEAYLAQEIDDNLARGMTPDAARAAAHRRLGNTTRIREEIYTMNSLGFLESLWQDLRYGVRLLRRNPGFTTVAVLTLALGTGANTAIFQLVNAVRLRTLPVSAPHQLADVRIVKGGDSRIGMFMGRYPMLSYPLYRAIADEQQVFTDVAAWGTASFDLAQGGEERLADGLWVSGNFFPLLGVRPALGRLLTPADDVVGCRATAVLGHAFWQREFGGDRAAVGRTVLLDGHRFDIIGVAAADFYGVDVGRTFDVALPLCNEPIIRGGNSGLARNDVWFLGAIGRLKAGLSLDQAGAHLASLSPAVTAATVPARYNAEDARGYRDMVVGVRPGASGTSALRRNYGDSLNILFGVTALVLLIACANLASLLLARATARQREVAVRLAIGASRARVVRQMLAESLLIAIFGAAAGLIVAGWFSRSLVAFLASGGTPLFVNLALDWRVFAFTVSVAVGACLLFGLTPALRATRTVRGATLTLGVRGTTDGGARVSLRRALVVLQVALSLVLVVGALLFGRSLRNLTAIDPGFRPAGVMTALLDLRKAKLSGEARTAVRDQLLERLSAIPGVRAVGQSFTTPVGGNFWNNRVVIGGALQKDYVNFNMVSAGYFDALGIRLVAGRVFDNRDTLQSPKVAMVSESFARQYFNGRDPVGQTFRIESAPGEPQSDLLIVGVVKDTKYADLREPFLPLAHVAATQEAPGPFMQFVVRADLAPTALTAAMTRAIADTNRAIAIRYQSVDAQLAQSLLQDRLMATLSAFFGGLAALIATLGLYGLMSYIVARRRGEIGVRMALGADAAVVVRMMVREAAVLLAVGLALGTAVALFAAKSASALLYGLKPGDPATVAMAVAALASVTLLAGWIPARRAARVDPAVALRTE